MKHYTLFELNQEISEVLSTQMEPSYWVIAEISQIQVNQKGHCYLELVEKEDDRIKAKMRGTIWSYTYRNLITWFEKMTRQTLKPGMKILFNAAVQFHEVYGISLNIKDIDANFTLGERAIRKAEIIEKLKEEGVFDMNKGLLLPLVPQRVAIVSSPTAAGYGDFMDQLSQNEFGYHFHTTLFQAVMQGDEAESSIIAALLKVFEQIDDFDLVVIIRGGGASVDLDCFDGYELASHIAQFPLPVVTGIGHERDETICDLVAHTKMKTPTAVSEFLIAGMRNYEENINGHFDLIYQMAHKILNEQFLALERMMGRVQRSFHTNASRHEKKLEQLSLSLRYYSQNFIQSSKNDLAEIGEKLRSIAPTVLDRQSDKLKNLEKFFETIHPDYLFKKGFTITKINGKPLNKYESSIKKGDQLTTISENATIWSEVIKNADK